MKKLINKLLVLGIVAPFFMACSADDAPADQGPLDPSEPETELSDVEAADLIGTWRIISMTSDVPVNLNADQDTSTDLLEETDCFDSMFFTFTPEGSVTTGQAALDFGDDGSKFDCEPVEYNADYDVEGNELFVYFTHNGIKMADSKTIALSKDDSGEYLHVSISDDEVALYFEDPGNTVLSSVGEVELVFIKQ